MATIRLDMARNRDTRLTANPPSIPSRPIIGGKNIRKIKPNRSTVKIIAIVLGVFLIVH
jgi:hypothetical protein